MTDFLCGCKVAASGHQGDMFPLSHPDRGEGTFTPNQWTKTLFFALFGLNWTNDGESMLRTDWFTVGLLIIPKPIVMSRLMWRWSGIVLIWALIRTHSLLWLGMKFMAPKAHEWYEEPMNLERGSGSWLSYQWMSTGYPAPMHTLLSIHLLRNIHVSPVETIQRFGALAPSFDFLGDVGSTPSHLGETSHSLLV